MTVKADPAPARTQRKAIARLPDALMARQRELVPDMDSTTVVALFALRAIAQRIHDRTNDLLAPLGLNAAKYNYLVVIYMTPGDALTLNEISDLIHTTNSSVTAMISVLEKDGLVRRSPNPHDGRSVMVRLTPRGRARVERAIPLRTRDAEQTMSRLSPAERAQFASLLLRIGAGLDQDDLD